MTVLLALALLGGGCDACASHELGNEARELGPIVVRGHEIIVTARLRGRRNTENQLGGRMSGVRVATEGERWTVGTFVASSRDTVELVDMAGMPSWAGTEEDEAERRFEALALELCAGSDGSRVYRVGGLDDGTWRVVESIETSVLHAAFESEADDCPAAVRDAPDRDALLQRDWHDALPNPNRRSGRACGPYWRWIAPARPSRPAMRRGSRQDSSCPGRSSGSATSA